MQENNTNLPRILIIEDDLTLAKMYSEKFKAEGFEVFTSNDGEDGLKKISENKPDFVLLDMMLPKFTGQDVLEHLQKLENAPNNLAIIALTNLAQKEDAQKALQLGAKEYLVKAMYTPEQVVQKVKQYLNLS